MYYWVLTAQAGVCSPPSLPALPHHVAQGKAIHSSDSQFPFLSNGGQNRAYLSEVSELNQVVHIKHLAQRLVQSKCPQLGQCCYAVTCFRASDLLLLGIMLADYLIFDSLR